MKWAHGFSLFCQVPITFLGPLQRFVEENFSEAVCLNHGQLPVALCSF